MKLKVENGKILITEKVIATVEGGGRYQLIAGSQVTKIVTFAGKGKEKPVRVAKYLTQRYGGKDENWKHVRGEGVVDFDGIPTRVELHWFDNEDVGIVQMKIKRWFQ